MYVNILRTDSCLTDDDLPIDFSNEISINWYTSTTKIINNVWPHLQIVEQINAEIIFCDYVLMVCPLSHQLLDLFKKSFQKAKRKIERDGYNYHPVVN